MRNIIKSSKRPASLHFAVYFMTLNIYLSIFFCGYKYSIGAMSATQLNADLLVLAVMLFFPWRIWLAGKYSRFIYTLMAATWIGNSVEALFFGTFPEFFADHLLFYCCSFAQVTSLIFLYLPATTAWFLSSDQSVQSFKKT